MRTLGIVTLVLWALAGLLLWLCPDDLPFWLFPMQIGGFTGIAWVSGRYFSHLPR